MTSSSQRAPSAPRVARLPNLPAAAPATLHIASAVGLPSADIELLDGLPPGLSLSSGSGDVDVVGIPEEPGEFVVRWRSASDANVHGELRITVVPDPRTLWKDTPSDASAPHWKPDNAFDDQASLVADVIAGSVRGRSHAHVGGFREDEFALHLPPNVENGWHILCVADGAGSASLSRKGSELACRSSLNKLRDLLSDATANGLEEFEARSATAGLVDRGDAAFWTPWVYRLLGEAARCAHAAIAAEAYASDLPTREYATTLLVAIARRTTERAWFVATYWVGDGALAMWKSDWESPKVFGTPDSGEYAGQTAFLTAEDFNAPDRIRRRINYTIVENFDLLALMTDGVADHFFETESALRSGASWRAFAHSLSECGVLDSKADSDATEEAMLSFLRFWSSGNHDDRTLLLLRPSPCKDDHEVPPCQS